MARILLYGLGDLGEKAAYLLAAFLSPADELVLAGRRPAEVDEVANMARMVARARPRPPRLERRTFSLQPEAVREVLVELRPDVFLFVAAQYSWWRAARLPAEARGLMEEAGFAVWLPCQAALPLTLAPVLTSLDEPPWLLLASYPDVVSPVLARRGVRRVLGFGNVDELAMVVEEEGIPPADIRLVAHHSVEAALFSGRPLPPYRLTVEGGSTGTTHRELRRPFPWPSKTRSHVFTASSLVRTVRALLGERPAPIHIPGPLGLPGGYPCLLGAGAVRLRLPPDLPEKEAVAINVEAARADGVERMEADGTVRLTPKARTALKAVFGVEIEAWTPVSMTEAGTMLERKAREMSQGERR